MIFLSILDPGSNPEPDRLRVRDNNRVDPESNLVPVWSRVWKIKGGYE